MGMEMIVRRGVQEITGVKENGIDRGTEGEE